MSGIQKWGIPTWVFFHTYAAKINKNFFERNRHQCLLVIKIICSCLPCPECTKHATHFMKKVNVNTVRTKEELINMLFIFHNQVNRRTGKKIRDREILETYKKYRMDIAYINFMNGYPIKYGRLMSGGIRATLGKRKSIAKAIQNWMKRNWEYLQ